MGEFAHDMKAPLCSRSFRAYFAFDVRYQTLPCSTSKYLLLQADHLQQLNNIKYMQHMPETSHSKKQTGSSSSVELGYSGHDFTRSGPPPGHPTAFNSSQQLPSKSATPHPRETPLMPGRPWFFAHGKTTCPTQSHS